MRFTPMWSSLIHDSRDFLSEQARKSGLRYHPDMCAGVIEGKGLDLSATGCYGLINYVKKESVK